MALRRRAFTGDHIETQYITYLSLLHELHALEPGGGVVSEGRVRGLATFSACADPLISVQAHPLGPFRTLDIQVSQLLIAAPQILLADRPVHPPVQMRHPHQAVQIT